MKVYVDELPKNCFECPCFRNDIDFPCGLGDGTQDYFLDEIDGGNCPLKSLADHTKQVRKEVCEDISEKLMKRLNGVVNGNYSDNFIDGYSYCCSDIENILDQIQGDQSGTEETDKT